MADTITEYPHFFTATNLEWKKLLIHDKYKNIVIESLRFLVNDKRVIVYGFVIMDNHIHVIWQLQAGRKRDDVQRDFLKYTAQLIKKDMIKNHAEDLKDFMVKTEPNRLLVLTVSKLYIFIFEHQRRKNLCQLLRIFKSCSQFKRTYLN